MSSYRVALTASAEKELHGLPSKVIARITPRIEDLAASPRPPGCKKLKDGDKEWPIRVGDYRAVYEIDDEAEIVDVTRIAHRREVYKQVPHGHTQALPPRGQSSMSGVQFVIDEKGRKVGVLNRPEKTRCRLGRLLGWSRV